MSKFDIGDKYITKKSVDYQLVVVFCSVKK